MDRIRHDWNRDNCVEMVINGLGVAPVDWSAPIKAALPWCPHWCPAGQVWRVRSMEFNFPREKAPQSRFSRCLELYGNIKAYMAERFYRRGQTSSFLPSRFRRPIRSTSWAIVRRRVHRIIPADGSSCATALAVFRRRQIPRKSVKTDIDYHVCPHTITSPSFATWNQTACSLRWRYLESTVLNDWT